MPTRLRVVRVKCKRHGEWAIFLYCPLSKYDQCKQCFTQLTEVTTVKSGANNDQINSV